MPRRCPTVSTRAPGHPTEHVPERPALVGQHALVGDDGDPQPLGPDARDVPVPSLVAIGRTSSGAIHPRAPARGRRRGRHAARRMRATLPMAPTRVAVVLGAGGTVGHAFHAGVLAALHRRARLGRPPRRPGRRHVGRIGRLRPPTRRAAGRRPGPTGHRPAAVARGRGRHREGQARAAPADRARGRPELGRMASPARLARALRAPWEVRAGLARRRRAARGTHPDAHIAAPFDALFGGQWPAAPTVGRRRRARHRPARRVRPRRRTAARAGRGGAGLVRHPGVLRARRDRRPPLRRRRRALDHQRRPRHPRQPAGPRQRRCRLPACPTSAPHGHPPHSPALLPSPRVPPPAAPALDHGDGPNPAGRPDISDGRRRPRSCRLAPVSEPVLETTTHRLARSDVRERLTAAFV